MIFYRELGVKIESLVRQAYQGLPSDTRGGCMPVAFDGLFRGALSDERDTDVYGEHLRVGIGNGANRLFSVVEVVEGMSSRADPCFAADYYCSSSLLSSRIDLPGRVRPLCRREAEKMARRTRKQENLGVLIASCKKRDNEGHLFALIGEDGAIIRVDGRRMSSLTTCLSNRKAVIALRRVQRGGLVIEVGRIRDQD